MLRSYETLSCYASLQAAMSRVMWLQTHVSVIRYANQENVKIFDPSHSHRRSVEKYPGTHGMKVYQKQLPGSVLAQA